RCRGAAALDQDHLLRVLGGGIRDRPVRTSRLDHAAIGVLERLGPGGATDHQGNHDEDQPAPDRELAVLGAPDPDPGRDPAWAVAAGAVLGMRTRRRHLDLHVSDGMRTLAISLHTSVCDNVHRPMANATEIKSSSATAVTPEGAVGARVRSLREAMELSLRDLSERSGASAPMLSQVERGDTSPTLAVAQKIAAGLDLTLSQLLRLDEDRHVVIVRARERRSRRKRGHRVEELPAPLPGQRADVSQHTLAPGAATGAPDDPPVHEPGSRETAVVLDGTVELFIDGQRHELAEGDSVTFDADLPHHCENNASSETRLIPVLAAGLRRG